MQQFGLFIVVIGLGINILRIGIVNIVSIFANMEAHTTTVVGNLLAQACAACIKIPDCNVAELEKWLIDIGGTIVKLIEHANGQQ